MVKGAIDNREYGKIMWHLLEDFMDQNLVMKAFIGLGWLSVAIMVLSFFQQLLG